VELSLPNLGEKSEPEHNLQVWMGC